jgi:Tol biopolymer transport system component
VYEKGTAGTKPSVWIARDDGTGARRLGGGDLPHIAPDGATVLYQGVSRSRTSVGRMLAVSATGGTPRAVLVVWRDPFTFAWSPDAKTVATVTGPELGARRLVLVDVATGSARTVARGQFAGVSFSRAGDAIAYARAPSARYPTRTDVYVAAVAGGAPRRLTKDERSSEPVWGPATIAFTRSRRPARRGDAPKLDLWLMAPDGSQLRRLTTTRSAYLLSGLTPTEWSADGSRLLAEFGGQDTSYAEVVNPVSGRVRAIGRPSETGLVGFRLSRDGSTILGATGGFDPANTHAVVTVPYAGGRPRVIVRNAFNPDWTGGPA